MKIGQKGLNLIKEFEGLYLTAYKCPAGVWTIGYGTTGKVDGKFICSSMKITKEKAEALLKKDVESFSIAVTNAVKVPINQSQFDALVSFTYNLGAGALRSSTLLKKLNAKDYKGAAEEFLKWNKAGGKVLDGLTRRRKEERKLFLTATFQREPSKPSKTIYLVVTAQSGLKCRKTASTKGTVLGAFKKGTKLELLGKKKDWCKVRGKYNGKNIVGYCSTKYLK